MYFQNREKESSRRAITQAIDLERARRAADGTSMRTCWLTIFLVAAVHAAAQSAEEGSLQSYIPRPFLSASLSVNGSGFSPISPVAAGGFQIDGNHLLATFSAGYEGVRKTNDNTGNNPRGRQRSLRGEAFWRAGNGLYSGGGVVWSQLSTTNYAKQSWHPAMGGGKDFLRSDYSMRLQAIYLLTGSDRANGVHGAEVSLFYPSPAVSRHWHLRSALTLYRFHTTDTLSDPATSAEQKAEKHLTGHMDVGVVWRF